MKILTNKEYEHLIKCKEYYDEYVKRYKNVGKTERAKLARAKYWAKNKKRFAAMRAEQYRQEHPDAKKYKPRPRRNNNGNKI